VVPNAGWIAILVAFAEFAIGAALVIGFLTPLACVGSLILLFAYVMSGAASVWAFYALFAIVILVMWCTSSWIGVDGLFSGHRQRRRNVKPDNEVVPAAVSIPSFRSRTESMDGNSSLY
jgi:hypothetical protein